MEQKSVLWYAYGGGKPIFFEQKEKELVADFNRMLANTPNRVIKCHLMRN